MAAYLIADVVEMTDPAGFQEYTRRVARTVEQYGGKYLVRGGTVKQAEGIWDPGRVVVIEFETMEHLKKWYHSKEYNGPMRLRQQSASTNVLFVEGVSGKVSDKG